MNLTKALLGTIIKYPVSSLGINRESGNIREKKMGYFYADREAFEDIQRSNGTHGAAIRWHFFWRRRTILRIRRQISKML